MRKTKHMAFIIYTQKSIPKVNILNATFYNINGFQSDVNSGNQGGTVTMITKILVITSISQYIRHREMGWMDGVQYSP
jgi:hypothetical protein